MGYWGEIAKRAAGRAARDVRLGIMPLAVSFVGQMIVGGGLFILSGITSANVQTRVLSAVLPLLVFPIVFVVRLFMAPPALDTERLARIAEVEQEFADWKWSLIGGQDAKRHSLLSQFRDLYKLTANQGLSPELFSNLAWPPVEWLNACLERQGAVWRVDRIEQEKVFTRELEG
jgi:hypothetical protein